MSPSSSTKSPSSSTTNSSSSTMSKKSPSSSTEKSPSGYIAVSSISGRPPVSSYSCDFVRADTKAEKSSFCTTDVSAVSIGSVSTVSSILSDVRRCVRDSSVQYSVVGNSLYLTKRKVRSLRISCDEKSCKLWICSNGKETFDAEFSIYDVGRIASIYVDKYRFLE